MAKNGTSDKKLFVVGNHNDPGDENDATITETEVDPTTQLTAYPFRFTVGLGVIIKDGNGKIVGEQDLQPLTVYDQADAVEIISNIEPQQVSENG
jgi:hypothetical protein